MNEKRAWEKKIKTSPNPNPKNPLIPRPLSRGRAG